MPALNCWTTQCSRFGTYLSQDMIGKAISRHSILIASYPSYLVDICIPVPEFGASVLTVRSRRRRDHVENLRSHQWIDNVVFSQDLHTPLPLFSNPRRKSRNMFWTRRNEWELEGLQVTRCHTVRPKDILQICVVWSRFRNEQAALMFWFDLLAYTA